MKNTILPALGGLALTGCAVKQEIHADVELTNGEVATLVGNTLMKGGYVLGGDEMIAGKGKYNNGEEFYFHNGSGGDPTKMTITSDAGEIDSINRNKK